MIKTYHTAGPWRKEMAYGHKIKAPNGKLVADIITHNPLSWESSANACLVAAAPELLAACMRALKAFGKPLDSQSDVRQDLQKAIDKATGKTQDRRNGVRSSGTFWKADRDTRDD